MQIRHVGIVTNNIDEYKSHMVANGFVIQSEQVETIKIVKFEEGLELLEFQGPLGQERFPPGISHVAWTVHDGVLNEWVHERPIDS